MKRKKLNLRNCIVRTITYTTVGLTIASFYGWFMSSMLEKLLS